MRQFYLAAGLIAAVFVVVGMSTKPDADVEKVGTERRNSYTVILPTVLFNGKDLMVPRMTTAQRNAVDSPVNGLRIFNTEVGLFQVYSNASGSSRWITIPPAGSEGC